MSKTIQYAFILVAACSVYFAACSKKSSPPISNEGMNAKVNGTQYNMNSCQLYQSRPATTFWIVDALSYNNYDYSAPIYPRIQLRLWQFNFATGTYNIGTDSVTAYYYPTPIDTIPAIDGVINVDYISPQICGGIGGKFTLTLKDGTVITDGKFNTGPYCYGL